MEFRSARREDLPAIVALITDENTVRPAGAVVDERYRVSFEALDRDPRNELIVAEDGGEVIGCLQVTYIPGLGGHGRERAHVEAMRVRPDRRGRGVGGDLLRHTIERARDRGCTLVQLMSNNRREEAHRFYRALGFVESHKGLKLVLD